LEYKGGGARDSKTPLFAWRVGLPQPIAGTVLAGKRRLPSVRKVCPHMVSKTTLNLNQYPKEPG